MQASLLARKTIGNNKLIDELQSCSLRRNVGIMEDCERGD
jgi:hypothetical protein